MNGIKSAITRNCQTPQIMISFIILSLLLGDTHEGDETYSLSSIDNLITLLDVFTLGKF